MSEAQRIADQMKRAFVGGAWHGPALLEILQGVDARQALARPLNNTHNIWEILLHISAWNQVVYRRIRGDSVELTDEQDWPLVTDTSEAAWLAALEQLKRAHNQLEREAAALPDESLSQPVAGKDYDLYFLLHGIVQHDLYHAGQIALLKKAL